MLNKKVFIKRIIDLTMILLLLSLMLYQVTGTRIHEWIGIVMTLCVIFHQILNWQWFSAIFKGKFSAYLIALVFINFLLLISFVVAAISGMSMSGYAVPSFYGAIRVSTARALHLSATYWFFILCGLHFGMHIPSKVSRIELANKIRRVLAFINALLALSGLYVFYKNKILDYLLARLMFPLFDDSKSALVIFLEYFLILQFCTFSGFLLSALMKRFSDKKSAN